MKNSRGKLKYQCLEKFDKAPYKQFRPKKVGFIDYSHELESGWWDGLCNGERGWFPSNYVTNLDDEDDISDDDKLADWIPQQTPDGVIFYYNTRTGESSWELPIDDNDKHIDDNSTARDSSSASLGNSNDTGTGVSSISSTISSFIKPRPLPENWITQSTEDGNTYYYLNTVTQEVRWTYPGDDFTPGNSDTVDDKDDEIVVNSEGIVEREVIDDDADRESTTSSRDSRLSTGTTSTVQQIPPQSTDEKLPPGWGKKTTPQGKVYYFNKTTEETTWSLDNIGEDGHLLPPGWDKKISPRGKVYYFNETTQATTWSLDNIDEDGHLIKPDDDAVSFGAARENAKQEYQNCTNAIVESIRIMLYASGTVEKESPIIRQNRTLKTYHRHIMASLSKLVLSTKVASGVWPPPDAAQKMKNDADEVLVSVRQFVQAAENTVDIKPIDPKITESPTGGSWRGNNLAKLGSNGNKFPAPSISSSISSQDSTDSSGPSRSLTPDILASLEHFARTISKAIMLINNLIRKHTEIPQSSVTGNNAGFAPQLVTQTRQVVTHVGQFLSMVEDINLEDLDETSQGSINEFKIAKQALYNNIAGLVICAQSSTDPSLKSSIMDHIQISANVVEKSVKDVIIAAKFLMEEKDTQDQLRIQMRTPRRSNSPEVSRRTTTSIENDANDVTESTEIIDDQNGTPISPPTTTQTGLQTVPEDDVITTDSLTIVTDSNTINTTDDSDKLPTSPVSDGSSMTGGRSYMSGSSSQFRDNTTDSSSIQSYGSSQRTNTQSVVQPDHRSSSPPLANNPGGTRSPRSESSKVAKFFGEDVQSINQTRVQREDKPWFLKYDYDEAEIIFNMEKHVKGGTLNALVERLTMHDLLDSSFIATFLLTYRSFCTTEQFFDMLTKRFMIQAPDNLSSEQLELWQEKKQTPVRLRVFNIMKSWLENYYIDDKDSYCLERIREFAGTTMHEHMAFAAVNAVFKEMIPNNTMSPPPSIKPKNLKKIKFLDLDPLEIARQLTIIEAKLYNKIRPVECLNKAWSKETKEGEDGDGEEIAVNIKAMIVNSNQITGWVAESILNQKEIKKRCALIKHFVAVADKCRQLNNFNSLTAIISGLNSAPIHRLKRTWEMVNARTIQTLDNLNRIMNSTKNFNDYREMLHSVNPPCVPFLGVYLTDLTFIEDGNPDILKKNQQLINFSKRMKTADVIREIQQYQSVPYNLTPVQEIQIFIQSHLQDSRDVSDLYNTSLDMEPR
ncbi:40260_t:CDS:10 [Gigaspora margarita]|uniref:40260_t:CDS:1 n=1 Tax=Gigaspora margarita TaxID=4874 RepID=A0ABN7UP42_GIGMA|nr:40260_t:CDS:10 [Gigaspora margarita]